MEFQRSRNSRVETDTVKPGRAIDLRPGGGDDLTRTWPRWRTLNPSLLRMATPDDPSFCAAPAEGDGRKRFSAGDRGYPGGQMGKFGGGNRVESGETLTSIAKKYRVTPGGDLRRPTTWRQGRGLEAGEKLIIPAAAAGGRDQEPTGCGYRVRARGTRWGESRTSSA